MNKLTDEEKDILKALSRGRTLTAEGIIFWIADHLAPPRVSYHNIHSILEGLIQKGFVVQDGRTWNLIQMYSRTKKRA